MAASTMERHPAAAERAVALLHALKYRWRTVTDLAAELDCDRVTVASWCAVWERRGLLRWRGHHPVEYALDAQFGGVAQ